MLGTITSLVWNTLPYRCKFATLALRSHLRHFTSSRPPKEHWEDLLGNQKPTRQVAKAFTEEVKTPAEMWEKNSEMYLSSTRDNTPVHTFSGRSVLVKGGNVADAYGRLQSILQRNRVQAQLRLTERHEKKGVKRRRLSSERWRKQFAHEVRKKVQLVAKIRNRGA
ncbi:hypothetical protein E4T56_gene3025 [Termitomyces sp. T112]|nr:hypothetical protein C0989_011422 [Termitomyces sp. Mn162]KAG5715241.1 hypothetical protein E4T56_gene3025 [Termitomyces sp. T112]KAH0583901.1 hypothetical protein H2248_009494 [Termitomyces sp. 'cryptogamus']